MENRNIIIILVAVIVVLAAILGVMFLQPNAKEPTKVKITSKSTLYEGKGMSIQLIDLNKTPISKQIVNITITNKKGKVVVDDVVKTDSKGKAKLDLDLKKGKYSVDVRYGGNENYTGSNDTQKLTVKEEVVETQTVSSNSQSSSSSGYDINNLPPTNDPYPETNRYFIDDNHVKQEYADGYMRTVDVRTGEIHSLGFK